MFAPARSMFGLVGVFGVSRLFGLVREVGIAYYFGTSIDADRWAAAFGVAGVAAFLTGEATLAAAVRWLGEHRRPSPDAAYAVLVRRGARASVIVAGAYLLIGPPLTLLVLGDFGGAWADSTLLAVSLAPWVGASILSSCINAELILQRRFVLINGVQMLYSVGAVAGLVAIHLNGKSLGTLPVAIGWSAGNLLALVVLYFACRPTYPIIAPAIASVRTFLAVGIPVGIAYSLLSVQELTDRAVAGRLGTGDVAALSYANRLFLVPFGFVIAALGPMVLGTLTSARAELPAEVARTAVAQLRSLARFLSPIGLAFAAIGPALISLVFEYGAFGRRSTELTTDALDGLSVGFSSVAISFLMLRAMQAVAQLRSLVIVSLGTVIANAALSIILGVWLGLYGVTLATSLVALSAIVAQVALLGRTLGRAWSRETYRTVWGPVVVACVLSAALVSADRADVISQSARVGWGLAGAAAMTAAVIGQARRQRM